MRIVRPWHRLQEDVGAPPGDIQGQAEQGSDQALIKVKCHSSLQGRFD